MQAELLRRGELFTDPEFPATNSSLFYSAAASEEIRWNRGGYCDTNRGGYCDMTRWVRPGDLCRRPHLFVAGADRMDINQVT